MIPHCFQKPLTTPARFVNHVPLLHKNMRWPSFIFCVCAFYLLTASFPSHTIISGAPVIAIGEVHIHRFPLRRVRLILK
nr:MAG TPA: hypothetical protein [Caudoviricetes sp.]